MAKPEDVVEADVLVVEDQPAVARALGILFGLHGITTRMTPDPDEALAILGREQIGLVVQDMNFTPGATSGDEGVRLFRRVRESHPEVPVLLLTAWTSLETAVTLVKEGAADYLAKPWSDEKLLATVRNLLRLRRLELECTRLRAESRRPREELARTHDLRGLIYESEAMHRVVSLAVQVAASDAPVLITGPNGAGKERLAEIVHANSRRRGRPFVTMNAGALPDELLESELFGAEAGAYTGSQRLRIGRFEAADGGTLFLDEIGTLSPAGQVKLLRVLESGSFERLGSSVTRRVDVRFLAATNADLRKAIADGTFREDLYFRLDVVELRIPALSERTEDILPLAEAFLREEARAPGPGPGRGAAEAAAAAAGPAPRRLALGEEARAALLHHSWPGNVRELQNRIRRARLVAANDTVTPADLGLDGADGAAPGAPTAPGSPLDLEAASERTRLETVLTRHGGSVSRTAEELGVSRQTLYRRMERLGITLERRPRT